MSGKKRPAIVESLERRVCLDASQLSESIVSSTLPASVSDEATLKGTVVVDVANNSGVAQKFQGAVEALLDLPSGQYVLKSQKTGISLAVGASKIFKLGVAVAKGKLVDATDTLISETIEPATGTSSLSPAGPTVQVRPPIIALSETEIFIKLPTSKLTGLNFKSTDKIAITNSGSDPSSDPLTIGVYATPDGTIASGTPLFSELKKIVIKPGRTVVLPVAIRTGASLTAGTYEMISAVTQANGTVTDTNPVVAPKVIIAAPTSTSIFVDTIATAMPVYSPDASNASLQYLSQMDLLFYIANNGLASLGPDQFTLFASAKPTFDSTATKIETVSLHIVVPAYGGDQYSIDFGAPDISGDTGAVVNDYIFVQVVDSNGPTTMASDPTPIEFGGPVAG